MSEDKEKMSGFSFVSYMLFVAIWIWMGLNCYQNKNMPQTFKNAILAILAIFIIALLMRFYIDLKNHINSK